MGLEVLMDPGKGPSFPAPLKTPQDMDERLIFSPNVGVSLRYMFDAITLTRRESAAIHAVSDHLKFNRSENCVLSTPSLRLLRRRCL